MTMEGPWVMLPMLLLCAGLVGVGFWLRGRGADAGPLRAALLDAEETSPTAPHVGLLVAGATDPAALERARRWWALRTDLRHEGRRPIAAWWNGGSVFVIAHGPQTQALEALLDDFTTELATFAANGGLIWLDAEAEECWRARQRGAASHSAAG
jgi:hypothetical protein